MIEQVLRAILPHRFGIPYLIIPAWPAPRFTQDIDIVIAPTSDQLDRLVEALRPEFVINPDAARDAYFNHGEFSALHDVLIFKVDFWFSTGNTFDTQRLTRATPLEVIPGLVARVATPEDAILSKPLWLQQGATERSAEDIRGILRFHTGRLDSAYLEHMVSQLGLEDLWTPFRERQ